jgi:endonuclease YncB( thermonuclease family)/ABC-type phosphate/phosphonate transport system substrate-binding protein
MSQPKSKTKDIQIVAIAAVASVSIIGIVAYTFLKPSVTASSQSNSLPKLQTSSLTIGILGDPSNYNGLSDYLRSQFGNKVQVIVDGDRSISYSDVRNRLIRKEWDIVFTLSPMLSVAAKDNQYTFAARMFPNNPSYYQSAIFVKSNSYIKSLNDLKSTTTIALGDFNSASSFYMPAYDLFGKTLRVDMGHRSNKILEMVKAGQADVGAVASSNLENNNSLRVISLSRQIPGSGVYLSSKLFESDREILKKVLVDAPSSIKQQANYGAGAEPNYSTFVKISQKAEEVLKCADFQKNPVNFYCPTSGRNKYIPNPNDTLNVLGRINGWSRKDSNTEQFSLSSTDNKNYLVLINRQIFNQIPGASNPIALQNKNVKVTGVIPKKIGNSNFELTITQPDQLAILENSPASQQSEINYQVKRVEDGDTILVSEPSGKEIKVRFACIDTAEIPHSNSEQNSTALTDKSQFLWGEAAKKRMSALITQSGGLVTLKMVDTDLYGRKVAEVRLSDGTLAQEVLVREGLAMVYRKYIKNCPSAAVVEQAESQAKQQQLNIWGDSQFTPPWEWRRNKKSNIN